MAIKLITENKSKLNPTDFDNLPINESPLLYAVRHRNIELLKKALDLGFSITDKDRDGFNAFDLAIQTHQPEMAALMAERIFGVDAKQIVKELDPAIIVNGLINIEKTINDWKSKATQLNRMQPAAQAAAQNKMSELFAANPDRLRLVDLNGLTPLHYALLNGHIEAARFLVKYSDPSFATKDGSNYLHFAAMTGNKELVECIVQQMGISPNVPNAKGCTPAHFFAAVSNQPTDIVPLIKQGA
jgi:ankyrin repeat protein